MYIHKDDINTEYKTKHNTIRQIGNTHDKDYIHGVYTACVELGRFNSGEQRK